MEERGVRQRRSRNKDLREYISIYLQAYILHKIIKLKVGVIHNLMGVYGELKLGRICYKSLRGNRKK
jgi:hypothetical protein